MNLINPFQQFTAGKLTVKIYASRAQMGRAAAMDIHAKMVDILSYQKILRMIFAAAPSQNETLAALKKYDINWERLEAFHMDEYVGIDSQSPQAFGQFLRDSIFDELNFKNVELINPQAESPMEECKRYSTLINKQAIDICALGIGENGHLAFNDPPVADFKDTETTKIVELDEVCRQQQVNDGCFSSIELVPRKAFTLTIPTLLQSKHLFLSVPGASKAEAVYQTINDPIGTACPSTILREYANAIMYLDKDSAIRIL